MDGEWCFLLYVTFWLGFDFTFTSGWLATVVDDLHRAIGDQASCWSVRCVDAAIGTVHTLFLRTNFHTYAAGLFVCLWLAVHV